MNRILNFDENSQQGLELMDFEKVKKEALKTTDFNKPKSSFNEILYENKFGKESKCLPCEDKFYKGATNLKLLMDDIKNNSSKQDFFFSYNNYTKGLPKVDLFPKNDFLNINQNNYFSSKEEIIKISVSVPFSYKSNEKEKNVFFQVYLNERACYVNVKNYGFRFTFDIENNLAKYYLEFIYSDSLNERNFKKEVGNTYTIEHKFVAFSIESENIDDFIALAQYLELPNLLKQIRLFFTEQLKNSKTVDKLVFIYNKLPSNREFLKAVYINDNIIKQHIELLLKYDTTGYLKHFNDESGTLIKVFILLSFYDNNYTFLTDELIKTIYTNLSGSSEWEGQMISNKMLFANLLTAMALSNKLSESNPLNKIFYYGKGYEIDSDISSFSGEKNNEFFLQQFKNESYQVEIPSETDEFGVTVNTPGRTQTVTTKKKLDEGAMYKPTDLIMFTDYSGKEKQTYLVPAIYLKALAEEAEWEEVNYNIRIGFDILAVIGGLALLGTGNPGLLALAIADIAISGTDIVVQLSKEELQKTPEGQEFLKTWEEIYLVGGLAIAIVSAPQLIQSFYKVGNKILRTAKGALLVEIRQFYLRAFLEINISNFKGNTVKAIEPTELFFSNSYRSMAKEMEKNGVIFISGQKEGELLEYYAAIYKGEIIEEFTKVTKDNFAGKYWRLKGEKLIEVLENIVKVKTLKVKPSWLPNRIISVRKNKTVTLIGTYLKDTKKALRDLNYPESINFGAKNGDFNLLNVPKRFANESIDFFKDYNLPWLKNAVERGDDIVVLSNKFDSKLLYKHNGELTGFGKEIEFMDDLVIKRIYTFVKEEGRYIKIKK